MKSGKNSDSFRDREVHGKNSEINSDENGKNIEFAELIHELHEKMLKCVEITDRILQFQSDSGFPVCTTTPPLGGGRTEKRGRGMKIEEKRGEKNRKPENHCFRVSKWFLEEQKANFPNLIKEITPEKVRKGAVEVEKCVRIDKFKLDEVIRAAKWAAQDSFWSRNLLSLSSLRNKCKNGETKLVNIMASMHSEALKAIPALVTTLPDHIEHCSQSVIDELDWAWDKLDRVAAGEVWHGGVSAFVRSFREWAAEDEHLWAIRKRRYGPTIRDVVKLFVKDVGNRWSRNLWTGEVL